MIIDTSKVENTAKYQAGDIIILDTDEIYILNRAVNCDGEWFFATFADGEGFIGDYDKNGDYYFPTIESLVESIKEEGLIIAHYSIDNYKLQVIPRKG